MPRRAPRRSRRRVSRRAAWPGKGTPYDRPCRAGYRWAADLRLSSLHSLDASARGTRCSEPRTRRSYAVLGFLVRALATAIRVRRAPRTLDDWSPRARRMSLHGAPAEPRRPAARRPARPSGRHPQQLQTLNRRLDSQESLLRIAGELSRLNESLERSPTPRSGASRRASGDAERASAKAVDAAVERRRVELAAGVLAEAREAPDPRCPLGARRSRGRPTSRATRSSRCSSPRRSSDPGPRAPPTRDRRSRP